MADRQIIVVGSDGVGECFRPEAGPNIAEPSLAASLKDDDRAEGYTPDYS